MTALSRHGVEPGGEEQPKRPTRAALPRSATLVAAQLRRRIVRGELREGDTVAGDDLLGEFAVSPPILGDALRILETENLLTVSRGQRDSVRIHLPDGTLVPLYTSLALNVRGTSLADVYEAVATLEAPCAGLVARRGDAADLAFLREALGEEDAAAHDPDRIRELETSFPRLLVDLTGNTTLGLMSESLRCILEETRRYQDLLDGPAANDEAAASRGRRARRRVVSLITARDSAGAESVWRKYVLASAFSPIKGDLERPPPPAP